MQISNAHTVFLRKPSFWNVQSQEIRKLNNAKVYGSKHTEEPIYINEFYNKH